MVTEWIVLCAGAFFAGLVDAMVGGGGLVQIPLLFNVFPGAAPATLFGTNKAVSVVGTAFAARRYLGKVEMDWATSVPAGFNPLPELYVADLAKHPKLHLLQNVEVRDGKAARVREYIGPEMGVQP